MTLPSPAQDLQFLLVELGRERSSRAKLGLLARSWSLLRQLSQDERERVALVVGSGWVWERLERFLLADGELRPWELGIKRVLEQVGSADPAELRRLAKTISRRGLHDLLQSSLRDVLEEEAALRERAALTAQEPAATKASSAKRDSGVEPEADRAPEPLRPVAATPARNLTPKPEPPAPPTEEVRRPAPLTPRTPPPRRSAPPVVWPAAPPLPPPPTPPTPQAEPIVAPVAQWEPPSAAALSARQRLARLRDLRAQPERAAALGPEGRSALVDALGPGWAARSALSLLLRSRAVGDLDEALRLVARLGSPMQRGWCLGDLVAHWDLDAEAERRVLDAAPSPATRRRLERRLGRSAAHASG